MSDQILGITHDVRPNTRSEGVDSQICRTFWERYVRPESMSVDTLGVYCMVHNDCFKRLIRWRDIWYIMTVLKDWSKEETYGT